MELSREEMMQVMGVFKEESREQLALFTKGLGDLGKNASDAAAIEVLHRTAHSMKGAARILGLEPIELISQQLEVGFKTIKDGTKKIDAGQLTLVGEAVRELGALIDRLASEGSLDGYDLSTFLGRLSAFR